VRTAGAIIIWLNVRPAWVQDVVRPKQKHCVQPSGFSDCKPKVPGLQRLHCLPDALACKRMPSQTYSGVKGWSFL